MTAYIGFDDYKAMGGKANEAAFIRLEAKARRSINSMTHNRLVDEDPVRESVKMCAFELIEAMAADEAESGIGGREISSMSNDGASVSFSTSDRHDASMRRCAIIRSWLSNEYAASGAWLLYAGVDG